MASASLPFNYMPTTNAAGTFNVQTTGYVAGTYIEDPVSRYYLAGGVLASTETLPMWGGVGISVSVLPNTGTNPPDATLGGLITRATTDAAAATNQLVGFSVFNQATAMVITPQNPVPVALNGMSVNWIPLGTNTRLIVPAAPALTTIEGSVITSRVSWDFVNQQLMPGILGYVAVTAGGITGAAYTSATGILALTFSAAPFGAGIAD